MSGPRDGRGGDAFNDFFGDPSPSGRMGPAAERPPTSGPDDTTRMGVGGSEDTPTQPSPAAEPSYEPTIATGAVPESWWASEPEPSTAASASTWDTTSAPAQADQRPPRKGVSLLGLLAMLVGGVLLGGLVVGGVVMVLGDDDQQPVAQQTVTTTSSPTEGGASESSDDSSTSTSSSSSSSSPSSSSSSTSSSSSSSSTTAARTGEPPSGVSECAGPSGGVAAGTGTDVTSCEFAVAVRDAYVAGGSNGSATLRVTSPVTNKAYTMSCSGEAVTRCTGGNNAVVVLY